MASPRTDLIDQVSANAERQREINSQIQSSESTLNRLHEDLYGTPMPFTKEDILDLHRQAVSGENPYLRTVEFKAATLILSIRQYFILFVIAAALIVVVLAPLNSGAARVIALGAMLGAFIALVMDDKIAEFSAKFGGTNSRTAKIRRLEVEYSNYCNLLHQLQSTIEAGATLNKKLGEAVNTAIATAEEE